MTVVPYIVVPYRLEYIKVKGKEGLQFVARVGGVTMHSPSSHALEKLLREQGYVPKKLAGFRMKKAKLEFG